jgi:hypothetical protein
VTIMTCIRSIFADAWDTSIQQISIAPLCRFRVQLSTCSATHLSMCLNTLALIFDRNRNSRLHIYVPRTVALVSAMSLFTTPSLGNSYFVFWLLVRFHTARASPSKHLTKFESLPMNKRERYKGLLSYYSEIL